MKNIIATLAVAALAAFPSHALTKDVDTVTYTALKDIPEQDVAAKAVLADVDEFVTDAERRIKELNKAALHHRGNALIYSAAERHARSKGWAPEADRLGKVVELLNTLAVSEQQCAASLSTLLTVTCEYDLARRIGPSTGDAVKEISDGKLGVSLAVAIAIDCEKELKDLTSKVRAEVEATKLTLLCAITSLKDGQAKEKAKDSAK